MLSVGIATLGCKVNQYESEAIAEALADKGFLIKSHSEICDAYIVNTCTVTAESDRKARQMIRRMISRNPRAYVLVAGCYSQISPNDVAAIKGVDYVCGSDNKMSIVDKLCELASKGQKNDVAEVSVNDLSTSHFEPMSIRKFNRTRAYVKIEDGCESKCAYCAIPASRGPIRSKPFEEVLNEVKALIDGGCREIVLTGIETGSYGKDLPDGQDFASLLCAIDKLDGIGRVRLGSLDPSMIRPAFVEKIKGLKSLAPHFHLSLQSGSSRILALMRRKYNAEMAMKAIELLRDAIPDVQFTTDVIVGFPGENDKDFSESCRFAEKARFLMMHVFPYSKRKDTLAAAMKEQLPENIKRERVHTLSEIAQEIRYEILDGMVGKEVEVLFESSDSEYAYGHTSSFIEVKVRTDKIMHSVFRQVRIASHDSNTCEGILIADKFIDKI